MNLQGDVNKTVSGINQKIKERQLAKIDKLKKYIKGMKKQKKEGKDGNK